MELVNATAVPATVSVATIEGLRHRFGIVTAKATFRLDRRAQLDTQSPIPLMHDDQQTELGTVPCDIVPRVGRKLEVIMIGSAWAPSGSAVREVRARLTVGTQTRELLVLGDRRWSARDGLPVVSDAVPFERMPLTWDRAFGGRADVEIDAGTFIEVADPFNRHGRGFDALGLAQAHTRVLGAPPGYPRIDGTRLVPNIEDPRHQISGSSDTPRPVCWAPVPRDSAMRCCWLLDRAPSDPGAIDDMIRSVPAADTLEHTFYNAHPDWIIDRPSRRAPIVLDGLARAGRVELALPALRILADYIVGQREATLELCPQTLLLMPDDDRMCIVYRRTFRVEYDVQAERGLRLRLAEGWFQEGGAA